MVFSHRLWGGVGGFSPGPTYSYSHELLLMSITISYKKVKVKMHYSQENVLLHFCHEFVKSMLYSLSTDSCSELEYA
jgi:hypothetical protein